MVNLNKGENYIAAAWNDARTCEILLANYDEVPASICFHAQQCVEKLVKQVFRANGEEPPRTHGINSLLEICCERGYLEPDANLLEAGEFLQSYATTARYVSFDGAERGEALASVLYLNSASESLERQGHDGMRVQTSAGFMKELLKEGAECIQTEWLTYDLGGSLRGEDRDGTSEREER